MDFKCFSGTAFVILILHASSVMATEPEPSSTHEIAEETSEINSQFQPDRVFDDDQEFRLLPPLNDPNAFWYGSAEVTFLVVDAQTGGVITLSQSDTTAPGVSTAAYRDGDGMNDRGYAPRMTFGRRLDDNWAIQSRFWELSLSNAHIPNANPAIPSTGTNFSTTTEADRLKAYTIDLEGLYSMYEGDWTLDTFAGVRYATFAADSQIHTFGVFTTGNFTNLFLSNGSTFDGLGVTYGINLRRKIGDTHAHAFFSARGGAMDGTTNSYGRSAGAVASSPSAPLVGAATVTRNGADAMMYTSEFQLGLEWDYNLRCIPANFFIRGAYEYQDWNIVGRPTGGAGFGGTIGEVTTNSFASAGLGSMQLNGLTFATGLTW